MNAIPEPVTPVESAMSSFADPEQFEYRAVCKSAVVSMVFAVMALLLSLVSELFVLIPLLGAVFGWVAMRNFKLYPNELVGKSVGKIGFWMSLVLLVSSVAYHSYVYATEVPEGYTRISYRDLRPDRNGKLPFAKKAETLDGKKVFIKGYVRPSDKQRGLTNFILVGDFGDCCFGGNPKPYEVIAISIVNDDKVDYSLRKRRIGGEFHLHKSTRKIDEKDIPSVFYEIHADHIK